MTLETGLAARLVAGIRANTPDATAWDAAGIAAALREVGGTPGAAIAAAALAAEDTSLTKPSAAAFRNHWPQNAGVGGPRISHDVHCPEHPLSVHPCPQCAAKRTPPPLDDPEYAAMRASLASLRARATDADNPRAPKLTDAESVAIARARIEKGERA